MLLTISFECQSLCAIMRGGGSSFFSHLLSYLVNDELHINRREFFDLVKDHISNYSWIRTSKVLNVGPVNPFCSHYQGFGIGYLFNSNQIKIGTIFSITFSSVPRPSSPRPRSASWPRPSQCAPCSSPSPRPRSSTGAPPRASCEF